MISQKTPKAAPKVAFAIMIAINVVICALKRARGASANGLVCLLRSVSLLQAGAGMGELHVGAFRTVPVPIAESLEKIRAEIASVEATQDVVDSPGHDDIVSFKHAEIIIAPSGIRGNPAVGVGKLFALRRLVEIPNLAFQVVAQQEESRAPILIAVDRVIQHGGVAGAVAESKNRLPPDLAYDGRYLVHLEVLDDKTAPDQRVVALIRILETVGLALMRRQRFYVGADDALGGNVQQIADEDAGQLPLGAGNHINLEVVGLQILHHLDHRQVKRLAPFQRSQPLHRRFHEPLRIRFVVGVRGAGKDRGLMRRALAQDVARVPVFQPLFEAERKLLVLFGRRIVRIVQRAFEEEHMVEVEGRRLAEEGAVHIKDSVTSSTKETRVSFAKESSVQ